MRGRKWHRALNITKPCTENASLFNREMLSDKTKRGFDLCVIPGCHIISWLQIPISAQCNSLDSTTNTGSISHMLFFCRFFVFSSKTYHKIVQVHIRNFEQITWARIAQVHWLEIMSHVAPPPPIKKKKKKKMILIVDEYWCIYRWHSIMGLSG